MILTGPAHRLSETAEPLGTPSLGPGPCAALIASRDWCGTPLGPREGWPATLLGALTIMLWSPLPMVLLWGEEGTLLYNDGYAAVVARRHPCVLGLPVREAWPEAAEFNDAILRACLAGEARSFENVEFVLDRHGQPEPAFFDLDYWPVTDAAGRPLGVLGAVVETTGAVRSARALQAAEERARAEAERWREAEERLRQALAGARAGCWDSDLGPGQVGVFGSSTRWDEGYRDIYGFPGEVAGTAAPWIERVHPDDLPMLDANVRAALGGGPTDWVQEFRIWHPTRGLRWIHDRVRLVRDEDGRPVRLKGLNFDITDRRQAEAERDRARKLLETFVEAVPGLVFAKDRNGRHLLGNRGFYEALGRPPELCQGRTDEEFLKDPEEALAIRAADRRIIEAGRSEQLEEQVTRADGTPSWWLSTRVPLRNSAGEVVGLIGSAVDITARKRAEAALAESEARFRNMADHAPMILWVTDPAGLCIYHNRLWHEFTGQSEAEALGEGWLEPIHPEDRVEADRVFADANLRRAPFRIQYRIRRADGAWRWAIDAASPRWDDDGTFMGFIGSIVDITDHVESQEAVEQARSAAEHAARHDSLTGLPCRSHFRDRLAARLAEEGEGARTALLFIDLDEFKSVNDAMGHPAGDALLVEAGRRLRACLGPGDFLARMGGDEFVVLRPDLGDAGTLEALAQAIIARMAEPFEIDGTQVVVGASIGIALSEGGRPPADDLIKRADIALYRAKGAGRGVFRFFESHLEHAAQARQSLRADLRDAVAQGALRLHYQPVVDLATLRPKAYEALVRWAHPTRGLLGPGSFIELAEASGTIERIGAWVLEEACRTAVGWPEDLVVSVNLSPRQFRCGSLVETVSGALGRAGLPGRRLQVEITESVLLQDDESVLRTLAALRLQGVRLAIDDFGTGYSSLGYLRRFAVDTIKIDRSFVADLSENPNSLAILRAVMSLGADLGVAITAEGIETPDQLEQLRRLGCRDGQGFLFGPPSPTVVR